MPSQEFIEATISAGTRYHLTKGDLKLGDMVEILLHNQGVINKKLDLLLNK